MTGKDFVLEEYKQLWSYYHRLLDERKNMLDWYFKVVGLPVGLIGLFLIQKKDQVLLEPEIGAGILTVIFLVGFGLFGAYIKESSNAKKYLLAARTLRTYVHRKFDDAKVVVAIDKFRLAPNSWKSGSTAFWRISPLIFINSGLVPSIYRLLESDSSYAHVISLFLISVILHGLLYNKIFANHNHQTSVEEVLRQLDGDPT